MTLAIIAENKTYRELLAAASSVLGEEDVHTYQEASPDPDIDAAIYISEGKDTQKLKQLATEIPVFAVLSAKETMNEEDRLDFAGVFQSPLRLGRVIEAVRVYKKQKAQKEKLNPIVMGRCTLDPKSGFLKTDKKGPDIRLTEKEQNILLYLYDNKDRPVTKQDLLDHVWGYADGVETHTLETHIYRLRQKIETDPSHPAFLITDGEGYCLNF